MKPRPAPAKTGRHPLREGRCLPVPMHMQPTDINAMSQSHGFSMTDAHNRSASFSKLVCGWQCAAERSQWKTTGMATGVKPGHLRLPLTAGQVAGSCMPAAMWRCTPHTMSCTVLPSCCSCRLLLLLTCSATCRSRRRLPVVCRPVHQQRQMVCFCCAAFNKRCQAHVMQLTCDLNSQV